MNRWLLAVLLVLAGCPSEPPPEEEPTPAPDPEPVYPSLLVTPEHKEVIRARLDREPYLTVLADIEATAAEDYEEDDLEAWDPSINGRNGERAQANAFLAWLNDDEDAAARAVDGFGFLGDHWDTNDVWDINIRMPHTLMGYTQALDLLRGTPWLPDEAEAQLRATLLTINGQFFEHFVRTEGVRSLVLGPAQNNHPIRTAVAIGFVALAFPEAPQSQEWADWAFSELDYLWGPDGRYVQADGVVSEGPFYFGFAWGVSTALFLAVENLGGVPFELRRDCANRNDADPWGPITCVDGEPFTFTNPLGTERYQSTVDWSLGISLPWGQRPPLADAYLNPFNGAAILTSFGSDGRYLRDWLDNRDRPLEMHHGADLTAQHLAWVDDAVAPSAPPWTHRLWPDGGHAVLRSSWEQDALWMLHVAEAGASRKTLHDHVDGTSFSLAALGEYLLIDPGYYKPNSLDNARTAHSPAHNVVLIDGRAAPDKGLLTNWGDADAELVGLFEEDAGHAASLARQSYQDSTVERTVAMVDGRFGVVLDRVTTTATEAREHRFRLHGNGGYGDGTFALRADGATWERPSGVGVDVFVASPDGPTVEQPPYAENQAPHVGKFALDRSVGHHGVMDAVVTGLEPDFVAVLAPYGPEAPRLTVTALEGATGFLVSDGAQEWQVTWDGESGGVTGPGPALVVQGSEVGWE